MRIRPGLQLVIHGEVFARHRHRLSRLTLQRIVVKGIEHNFDLVKKRFGAVAHVRELNIGDYPYPDLMDLFVKMDYKGWLSLEARTKPKDRIAAMREQVIVFKEMVAKSQAKLAKKA